MPSEAPSQKDPNQSTEPITRAGRIISTTKRKLLAPASIFTKAVRAKKPRTDEPTASTSKQKSGKSARRVPLSEPEASSPIHHSDDGFQADSDGDTTMDPASTRHETESTSSIAQNAIEISDDEAEPETDVEKEIGKSEIILLPHSI
jgi:hypothetical protein